MQDIQFPMKQLYTSLKQRFKPRQCRNIYKNSRVAHFFFHILLELRSNTVTCSQIITALTSVPIYYALREIILETVQCVLTSLMLRHRKLWSLHSLHQHRERWNKHMLPPRCLALTLWACHCSVMNILSIFRRNHTPPAPAPHNSIPTRVWAPMKFVFTKNSIGSSLY